MRLTAAAALVCTFAILFALTGSASPHQQNQGGGSPGHGRDANRHTGQEIFRFDTFGDEQLWTDVLRMQEVVPQVDPVTALAVGLKVDVEALPPKVLKALRNGQVDLTESGGHRRTASAERRRRSHGHRRRPGNADACGDHLCPLSLVGR